MRIAVPFPVTLAATISVLVGASTAAAQPNSAAPAQAVTVAESTPDQPNHWSVGVGLGWAAPFELTAPNRGVLLVRSPGGITIEPYLRITEQRTDHESFADWDQGYAFDSTGYGLGVTLGYPVLSRGPMAVRALVVGWIGASTFDEHGPRLPVQDRAAWLESGVAVDWWLRPQLLLSAGCTVPLLQWSQSRVDDPDGPDYRDETLRGGVVISANPTVTLTMVY